MTIPRNRWDCARVCGRRDAQPESSCRWSERFHEEIAPALRESRLVMHKRDPLPTNAPALIVRPPQRLFWRMPKILMRSPVLKRRGQKTIVELSSEFGVHQTLVHNMDRHSGKAPGLASFQHYGAGFLRLAPEKDLGEVQPSRVFLKPTKTVNFPVSPLRTPCATTECASPWAAEAAGWTTCLSSASAFPEARTRAPEPARKSVRASTGGSPFTINARPHETACPEYPLNAATMKA